MQLTYVLELLKPTKRKENILLNNVREVALNRQVIANELKLKRKNLTTANFKDAPLPSAVKNQDIREVKALHKLFLKSKSKKENIEFKNNQPICYNNQNYSFDEHIISFPLFTNKCERFSFPLKRTNRFYDFVNVLKLKDSKLGKASLFRKKNKWYFAVTIKTLCGEVYGETTNVMGIDIGLRQLAVGSVLNKHAEELKRQFHNGNHAGFIRKKHRTSRRLLGKAKKPKVIEQINNKEDRWMTNLNHKISRELVNLAVQEKVSVIAMEDLENIRKTAKSLKRADRSIHNWAFYELQQFIEYKAKLSGIKVEYINPKYTSQRCSKCENVKKSNRKANFYTCECGNHMHSDLNASRNIAQKYIEQQSA